MLKSIMLVAFLASVGVLATPYADPEAMAMPYAEAEAMADADARHYRWHGGWD
ncbi:hypothetical protein GGH94_005068 [Coemansia aciculifera]|uniref:Uncharacterized protein n=2 Tax=Coemansia TaxID=4863 RepID=A0A9W8GU12_9FUNG|nr:hypothetical protein GGI19_003292 [Coemansia pectinata]KAJ2861170.1 hypothetical protein GGH94_005068 [Coemansia aciculifera]